MSGLDTRHINRDSLFLLAELAFEGEPNTHRVRVRNLSAGGMMAESDKRVLPGTRMTVYLKNVSPVEGSVAWVQDQRFGIAFVHEIDPKAPRSAVNATNDLASPRYTRPSTITPVTEPFDARRLRKI